MKSTKLLLLLLVFLNVLFISTQSKPTNNILVLTVKGAIGPATVDYFTRGLKVANKNNNNYIIVKLDTPGGLDKSMRLIIQEILESDIPIITFVSPNGARAASAGTYMLYASHVAAMAPATNLGAATPVQMGMPMGGNTPQTPQNNEKTPPSKDNKSAMEKKVINDAVAYIQGLAKTQNRNADWAEKAVLEGKSLDAEQALTKGVIDIISTDLLSLVKQLNGKSINLKGKKIILKTTHAKLTYFNPDWRTKFLSIITSPEVAYMLLMAGIYGLFFEFYSPGMILPGVAGGISLLIALYALQMLPISFAGLGLLLLGIALIVSELFIPSFGVLGIGGTVAFAIGSILLLDPGLTGTGIGWPLILAFSLTNLIFFGIVISIVLKSLRKPISTGTEELIGMIGNAKSSFQKEGQIIVHGELWQATSKTPVKKGDVVKVIKRKGLLLEIENIH